MSDVEQIFRDDAPPHGGPKRKQVCSVPAPVMELLEGEIERRNVAEARFQKKLRAAAMLSGVPEGARFELKQNTDGTFISIIQGAGE